MSARYICDTSELHNGGDGIRFTVRANGADLPAFVVRSRSQVCAFLNRCAHMELELDIMPGRFFDNEKQYLICSTHGAVYEPSTGYCVFGPCKGGRLAALQVTELAQKVFLTDNRYQLVRHRTEVDNERR